MRQLRNVMRAQAQMASQSTQNMRLGVISGYDQATYCVKVQFPPDLTETGWIPLAALGTGSGWGIYAAPVIGDQVSVTFQDGDRNAGVAGLRLYDIDSAPLSVPSGEIWLVHKSGAFFKLTNDGKASFDDGHGASVVLNGDGTISSAGTWTHAGDLTVNGSTAVKAITSNGHDISSTHKHTGVTTGGSLSGTPQ